VLCAVAAAVLSALTAPGFLEHVQAVGEALRDGLRRIGERHGCKVRGRGLLYALELPAERGPALVEASLARQLLINSPQPGLLRFMPALNVSFDEIDEMVRRLAPALDEVLARPG
jgi:acetylornithine/N-succinyldiaminopimelate aminotransferase